MTTAAASPTPVAVLGLGPMGRALAAALLAAGHPTTVWNRTAGRDTELLAAGARPAASVEAAVRSATVIVVCLLDDPAVRATLSAVPRGWEDRWLVNLTGSTPDQARAFAGWAAERGIRSLDGAILTPTPAIGTPAAVVLYSGDEEVHAATRAVAASLGGTAAYLGTDPGLASAYDLAVLDLFHTAVHGLVHALALGAAEGVEPTRLAAFAAGIGAILPEMVTRFAQQLEDGTFPGARSTIASSRASVGHVIEAVRARGLDAGALRAAQAALDRAIDRGHGADGLARLATHLVGPSSDGPTAERSA